MKRVKWIVLAAIVAANVMVTPVYAQERKHEGAPQEQRGRFPRHPRAMRNDDFTIMLDIVKKASFDDNKTNIIQVACFGSHFSSKQCAQLLSLFSFDDNKLEALEFLAPRLVEIEDMDKIIKNITFSTNKDEAIEILSRRKRK